MHVHTVDLLRRPAPESPIRPVDHRGRFRSYRASLRESALDWPAVLCRRCRTRMCNGNFVSFVDFQFAQHPECRDCGSGRTQSISYGEPIDPDFFGPWQHLGGCVPRPEIWHCDNCDHEW